MNDIYQDLYENSYSLKSTLRGKVQSVFAFQIGGINYVSDLTNFELKSKPLDPSRVTFGKYSSGRAIEWTLKIGAIFDGGSEGSLHSVLWNYSGYQTPFIIRPFRDFDPKDRPYYQGTIRIPYKPDINVEAGETSTWNYEFKVIGHPVRASKPGDIMTNRIYDEF